MSAWTEGAKREKGEEGRRESYRYLLKGKEKKEDEAPQIRCVAEEKVKDVREKRGKGEE